MYPAQENTQILPHAAGLSRRGPWRMAVTLASLLAVAAATGCASYDRSHFIVGSVPDDYRTRHPIVVSDSEVTEDIVVSPNTRALSYRDRAVVSSFASRFKQSGAAHMAILVPSGSANEHAARRLSRDAAALLVSAGVPRSGISFQHYAAGGHGNSATLRLAYTGIKAEVASQCGDWNEDVLATGENRNYANFGCATQKNLAAMVANPSDLLGPRGESEIDATRRTNVINTWREEGPGELPALFD